MKIKSKIFLVGIKSRNRIDRQETSEALSSKRSAADMTAVYFGADLNNKYYADERRRHKYILNGISAFTDKPA